MKKLLTTTFVLGICFLLAFSAVLASSATWANQLQRDFLDRVEAGRTDALLGSMHPALRKEIDRPVLDELVRAMNDRLGTVTHITPTGIQVHKDAGGTRVTSKSTVQFQHGEATSTFVTLDGELIEFNFVSPQLKGWFTSVSDTSEYERRGEKFLRLWLESKTKSARSMMHGELQKAVSEEQLAAMSDQVLDKFGNLKSIQITGTRVGDASRTPTLFVEYSVEMEKSTLSGEIEIQFDGLKGHLLGFRI